MSIENIINNSHRSIHIVCLSTFRIIHINFHNPIKLKKKIYSFDSLSFQIIVFTIYNLIYIYIRYLIDGPQRSSRLLLDFKKEESKE